MSKPKMVKKYFGMTNYIKNLKNSGHEVMGALKHYMGWYKGLKSQLKAADRARVAFGWVDGLIAKTALEYPDTIQKITCKKGCCFCCYQNVDVSFDEAMLLVETENINWPEVEAQAKDEGARLKRCVFLGDDGCCTVYANRPLACRKYYVISDPKKCDISNSENDGSVDVVGMRDPEAIASAIMNCVDFGPMATMLLKAHKIGGVK